MATQLSGGISSSDAIVAPIIGPNPVYLSISPSPETPKKTEQDGSKGNAVVPSKLVEQSMADFTIHKFPQDHFKIKKVLTQPDVYGSNCLVLPVILVEEYILPLMDPREAQLCRTSTGKKFPVLDVDDGSFQHLVLKKVKNSYFVLTENWIPNFVTRKYLEAGDQVGVAWFNGHFFFKL